MRDTGWSKGEANHILLQVNCLRCSRGCPSNAHVEPIHTQDPLQLAQRFAFVQIPLSCLSTFSRHFKEDQKAWKKCSCLVYRREDKWGTWSCSSKTQQVGTRMGLNCSPGLMQTWKRKQDLSFGKLSSKSNRLNRLPLEAMEYPSLEGFKNRLGKHLSEVIKLQ